MLVGRCSTADQRSYLLCFRRHRVCVILSTNIEVLSLDKGFRTGVFSLVLSWCSARHFVSGLPNYKTEPDLFAPAVITP